jgi:hypothetical protein
LLLYFFGCVAAFTVIVLFMVWYSRFMFQKIYGNTREQIDCIISNGAAPAEWDQRLVKRLSRCGTQKEKDAAMAKHTKFVNRRTMDLILFMKHTSLVESEAERDMAIERLESFRRALQEPEYPAALQRTGGEL